MPGIARRIDEDEPERNRPPASERRVTHVRSVAEHCALNLDGAHPFFNGHFGLPKPPSPSRRCRPRNSGDDAKPHWESLHHSRIAYRTRNRRAAILAALTVRAEGRWGLGASVVVPSTGKAGGTPARRFVGSPAPYFLATSIEANKTLQAVQRPPVRGRRIQHLLQVIDRVRGVLHRTRQGSPAGVGMAAALEFFRHPRRPPATADAEDHQPRGFAEHGQQHRIGRGLLLQQLVQRSGCYCPRPC